MSPLSLSQGLGLGFNPGKRPLLDNRDGLAPRTMDGSLRRLLSSALAISNGGNCDQGDAGGASGNVLGISRAVSAASAWLGMREMGQRDWSHLACGRGGSFLCLYARTLQLSVRVTPTTVMRSHRTVVGPLRSARRGRGPETASTARTAVQG